MDEGMKKFDEFNCDQIVRPNLIQLVDLEEGNINFTDWEITLKLGGDKDDYIASWLFNKKHNQDGSIVVQFIKGTCCSGNIYRIFIRANLKEKSYFRNKFTFRLEHFRLSDDYSENEKSFRDEVNSILRKIYGEETIIQIKPFIIPHIK